MTEIERGRLKAVDQQSKDLGFNPSAVKNVYFPQKVLKFHKFNQLFPRFKSLKLSARRPIEKVSILIPRFVA